MYYDGLYQLFNITFTALPIIVFGMFDKVLWTKSRVERSTLMLLKQDVERDILLAEPRLYMDGTGCTFFSRKIFMTWMLEVPLHLGVVLPNWDSCSASRRWLCRRTCMER
jgi:hypothetical protein